MESVKLQENQETRNIIPIPDSLKINNLLQHPTTQVQSPIQPRVPPIKLVDVKKLLQNPPEEEWTFKQESFPKKQDVESQPSNRNVRMVQHSKTPVSNTSDLKVKYINRNTPEDSSRVTVSHVLDCLKVILPGKFDFSRLIPNEKVAALVIRYLKLDDNDNSRNIIKYNLKIIIDAAKTKEKRHSTQGNHPYLSIKESELQLGVSKIFPTKFSMNDVSNELLNCLCIVLKVDVFYDTYHILRGMIRKFTCEGQKLSEIIGGPHGSSFSYKQTFVDEEYNQVMSSRNKGIFVMNRRNSEKRSYNVLVPVVKEKRENLKPQYKNKIAKYDEKDIYCADIRVEDDDDISTDPTYESPLENKTNVKVKPKENFKSKHEKKVEKYDEKDDSWADIRVEDYDDDNDDDDISNDPTYENPLENKPKEKVKPKENLKLKLKNKIAKYKEKDIYWADIGVEEDDDDITDPTYEDPLERKPKEKVKLKEQPVEKKQKEAIDLQVMVKYIEENKSTADDVLNNFRLLFYLCRALSQNSNKGPRLQNVKAALCFIKDNNIDGSTVKFYGNFIQNEHTKMHCPKIPPHLYDCKKLKMKPVVSLNDLATYSLEDMLFMRENKTFHKSNGYYSQCVQTGLEQNTLTEKFPPDYVKNLTCESYKLFRRIVTKKIGHKVTAGLKYVKLKPGSIVFAKDFRQLSLGWVKGTVIKLEGSRRYVVQFNNGETWRCTPEQLRPFPDSLLRTRRPVKPKKVFDM